mmetsp:Transcript_41082/g.87679  ORF Transcript_41082/g.87679 Transcript_41082/m.87679 type:complete len:213 (+) Transcript_41082:144-782(+)
MIRMSTLMISPGCRCTAYSMARGSLHGAKRKSVGRLPNPNSQAKGSRTMHCKSFQLPSVRISTQSSSGPSWNMSLLGSPGAQLTNEPSCLRSESSESHLNSPSISESEAPIHTFLLISRITPLLLSREWIVASLPPRFSQAATASGQESGSSITQTSAAGTSEMFPIGSAMACGESAIAEASVLESPMAPLERGCMAHAPGPRKRTAAAKAR